MLQQKIHAESIKPNKYFRRETTETTKLQCGPSSKWATWHVTWCLSLGISIMAGILNWDCSSIGWETQQHGQAEQGMADPFWSSHLQRQSLYNSMGYSCMIVPCMKGILHLYQMFLFSSVKVMSLRMRIHIFLAGLGQWEWVAHEICSPYFKCVL